MVEKTINTAGGNVHTINSTDSEVVSHMEERLNYVDYILSEINDYMLYAPIFAGKSNLTVVDIGANIGTFSLYAQDCASVIYAVEPHPTFYSILCKLTADTTNIVPVQKAIVGVAGNVPLYLNPTNYTMHSTYTVYDNSITVSGITLSDLFTEYNLTHVDVLKIDIEGGEQDIVTMDTVSALYSVVDNWYIEIHPTAGSTMEDNFGMLSAIFLNAGYSVSTQGVDGLLAMK